MSRRGIAARPGPAAGLLIAMALAAGAPRAAAAQNPCPPKDGPITAADRRVALDSIALLLREGYVDEATARRLAGAIASSRRAGRYDTLGTAAGFAAAVTADLRAASSDRHLAVCYDPAMADSVATLSPEEFRAWRLAHEAPRNFGFARAEILPGNVGYLEIREFARPDLGGATAAAAMSFLGHTDALIVDLRENPGGSRHMVLFLLGWFFDQPTHTMDIWRRDTGEREQHWTAPSVPGPHYGRKPVYVLTSVRTFSAAEEFAYDLQTQRRGTVVGETTGGGANPGGFQSAGAGFAVFVPRARSINTVTGASWEGTGVTPDIAVPAADALRAAHRAALRSILDAESDPGRRAELERLIAEPAP